MGLSDGITQGYYKPTAGRLYSSTFHGTRFAPEASNNWNWLGKLTYKPSSTFKISYSFNQSVSISQNTGALQTNLEFVERSPGYQYEFQNILANANVYTHNTKYNSLSITHTLNAKTYYELSFGSFIIQIFVWMQMVKNGMNMFSRKIFQIFRLNIII